MNHGPAQTTNQSPMHWEENREQKGCQMVYTRKDRTQLLILYHYYNTAIKQYEYNASVNSEE